MDAVRNRMMAMSGSFPTPTGEASPTALRRLQRDFQKLLEEPIQGIMALPTEENILEWHYVIMGSPDTVYSGGYYHGKLVFQPDFPWQPPAICMITPNGRFRTNMRLCLSISDYHPESWNPGWTVASILVGLHSFMNEDSYAAGVENAPAQKRREMAQESIQWNLKNPEFTRMFPDLTADLQSDASSSGVGSLSSPPFISGEGQGAAFPRMPRLSGGAPIGANGLVRKRAAAVVPPAPLPVKKASGGPPDIIDLTDD